LREENEKKRDKILTSLLSFVGAVNEHVDHEHTRDG
jgi:hypothetical protein